MTRELELERALAESLKLQAHYAKLLNMHDGGRRQIFEDPQSWMNRLRATGKLPREETKKASF